MARSTATEQPPGREQGIRTAAVGRTRSGRSNAAAGPRRAPSQASRPQVHHHRGRPAAVLGALFFWYWRSTFTEDTDDAQVDGNLYQVSSRVTGHVIKVYVSDNQQVQAGQLLVEIDPTDYQVALEQAQADLASAQADYTQATVNVPITYVTTRTPASTTSRTDVRAARPDRQPRRRSRSKPPTPASTQANANAKKAQDDVDRYTPLVQRDVISKQQYDAAIAARDGRQRRRPRGQANVLAQQNAVTKRSSAAQPPRRPRPGSPPERPPAGQGGAVPRAAPRKPRSSRPRPGWSRPASTSPTPGSPRPSAGIVNKKNVQVGGNLAAGQDLLTIIPLTDLWVTANFKETQLEQDAPLPARRPSRSTPTAAASSPGTSPRSAAPPAPGSRSSRLRTPPATTSKSSSASPSASTSPTSRGKRRLRPAARLLRHPRGRSQVRRAVMLQNVGTRRLPSSRTPGVRITSAGACPFAGMRQPSSSVNHQPSRLPEAS